MQNLFFFLNSTFIVFGRFTSTLFSTCGETLRLFQVTEITLTFALAKLSLT